MTHKRCCWGLCTSDSRYPKRRVGVKFIPFAKPGKNNYHLDRCLRWIEACGRPPDQLNLSNVNSKQTFICSKHFVDGEPTEENPDPVQAVSGWRKRVGRHAVSSCPEQASPKKTRTDQNAASSHCSTQDSPASGCDSEAVEIHYLVKAEKIKVELEVDEEMPAGENSACGGEDSHHSFDLSKVKTEIADEEETVHRDGSSSLSVPVIKIETDVDEETPAWQAFSYEQRKSGKGQMTKPVSVADIKREPADDDTTYLQKADPPADPEEDSLPVKFEPPFEPERNATENLMSETSAVTTAERNNQASSSMVVSPSHNSEQCVPVETEKSQSQPPPVICSQSSDEVFTRQNNKYVCNKCDAAFILLTTLQTHIQLKHEQGKTDIKYGKSSHGLRCSKCNVGFKSVDELTKHKALFSCSFCHGTFCAKSELDQHMKSHPKIFTCILCYVAFGEKEQLEAHLKSHIKGSYDHCCSCGIPLRHNYKLENLMFMTSHKSCFICGAHFTKNSVMKAHIQRHTVCAKCKGTPSKESEQSVKKHIDLKEQPTVKGRYYSYLSSDPPGPLGQDSARPVYYTKQSGQQFVCALCPRRYKYRNLCSLQAHMLIVHKQADNMSAVQKL